MKNSYNVFQNKKGCCIMKFLSFPKLWKKNKVGQLKSIFFYAKIIIEFLSMVIGNQSIDYKFKHKL